MLILAIEVAELLLFYESVVMSLIASRFVHPLVEHSIFFFGDLADHLVEDEFIEVI
jgi:hypothetical protein